VSANSHRSSSRHIDVNTYRTADMGLWLRSANNGLVISDIAESGPITRFGFHSGDVIVSVNGHKVTRERDFVRYAFADDVRDHVTVVVMRNGREEEIVLEPAVFTEEQVVEADPLEDFGLVVDDRYNDKLVVWKVLPHTPAYYAGFRPGDVIVVFNGEQVRAPREFGTLVSRVDRNASVEVMRNNQRRTLDVEVAANGDHDSRRNVDVHRDVDVNRRSDSERREVLRVNPDDATTPAPATTTAPRSTTRTAPATTQPQPSRSVLPRVRGR